MVESKNDTEKEKTRPRISLEKRSKDRKKGKDAQVHSLVNIFFYPILLFGKEMGITQQKPKTQFFSKSNGLDPVPNPFSLESLSLSLFKKKSFEFNTIS